MNVNDQNEVKDEKIPIAAEKELEAEKVQKEKSQIEVSDKETEQKEEVKEKVAEEPKTATEIAEELKPESETVEKEVTERKKEEKVEQAVEKTEPKAEAVPDVTENLEPKAATTEKEVVEKAEESKEEKKGKKPVSENSEREDMMSLLNESFSKFKKGAIIDGTVVSVDEKEILVDVGFKSEGSIPSREFTNSHTPEVGEEIKVFIVSVEDASGRLKLSKKKADFFSNLERFKKMMENKESVSGILRRRVKGGMIVDIEDIEAFLPGSQISTKPIPNLDQFIGKESEFKILKIDEERRNIIVSRKRVMEEKRESQIGALKEKLRKGSELDGEVRNITDYGAFIDLGGIDGLLHITDMSWGHIKHPSDMFNIGDKIKVKVLHYNEDTNKVALGIKQLVPPPWENIETKYPEGSVVTGKAVNITKYGVFVELEPGVEGLVHVSEMSWTKKIKHPNQIVKFGDTVKAIVLEISKNEHRISLGMKQMDPNPWIAIDERYPVGSVIKGRIKSITPFGVFVEVEKDIEGLIHISDISWTKRIYHPREVYKRGQEVEVKILSIDKTLHRIALGVKQLLPDPWEHLDKFLPINSEVRAKIVKIIPKGILVDVPVGENFVEGFVPLSHLGIPNLRKITDAFYVNEELPLKTIELDLENRRLILSVKAYFFSRNKVEMQDFIHEHHERMREKLEQRKAKSAIQAKKEKMAKTEIEKPQETAEEQVSVESPEPKKPVEEKVEIKTEAEAETEKIPAEVKAEEKPLENPVTEKTEETSKPVESNIEEKPAESDEQEKPVEEKVEIQTEAEPEIEKVLAEGKAEEEPAENPVPENVGEIPEPAETNIEEKPEEPVESEKPTEENTSSDDIDESAEKPEDK